MMHIIYNDGAEDVIVESIILNGHDGAVSISDSSDDIDLTFEDMDTAREWIAAVTAGLDELDGEEQRDAANPDRKTDEGWSVIDHRAGRFLGKTVAARMLRARAAAERGGE